MTSQVCIFAANVDSPLSSCALKTGPCVRSDMYSSCDIIDVPELFSEDIQCYRMTVSRFQHHTLPDKFQHLTFALVQLVAEAVIRIVRASCHATGDRSDKAPVIQLGSANLGIFFSGRPI